MSGGWNTPQVGDDADQILQSLSGMGRDPYERLPKGFAGITPTSCTNGQNTTIAAPLNAWLRIKRFVLGAAACVDKNLVADLKIGTISLNVGTQAIPCAAFKPEAVGTGIEAAIWASPSVPPSVVIFNNTAAAIVVEGGFIGPVSLSQPSF